MIDINNQPEERSWKWNENEIIIKDEIMKMKWKREKIM